MEGLCSICHLNKFKYTCPSCGVQTCCVECVRRHKKQTECPGTVDKTRFVPRSELSKDSAHMNRDYNFLMNVDRHIQLGRDDVKSNAKNVFKRQFGPQGRNKRFKPATVEDTRIDVIKKVFPHDPPTTTKRENTLVIQLPAGMERALSNKTGYDKKLGSFVWTIEWVFIGANRAELARFISYRLKEHLTLIDAIPLNILNNTKTESPIQKKDLLFYLHNVIRPDKALPVIGLDREHPISAALKDKVVLEYPTIYITTDDKAFENTTTDINEAYGIDKESESDSSESDSDSDSDSDYDSDSSDQGPEESSSKLPDPIKFIGEIKEEKKEDIKEEKKIDFKEDITEEAKETDGTDGAEPSVPTEPSEGKEIMNDATPVDSQH